MVSCFQFISCIIIQLELKYIFLHIIIKYVYMCIQNINSISEPIGIGKCTDIQQENQVFRLNAASAQIVDSLCSIKEEISSMDHTDEQCRKLQSKLYSVLQSCANQHLVSNEVYSEKPMKKKPLPCTYKIKQKVRTVFKCTLYTSVFSSRERLNNHCKFNHSSVTAKKKIHICSYCGKKLNKLNKHINHRHKNGKETINYKQKTAVNNIVYQNICILCKKTFERESDLEKHFPTCGLLNSDKGIKNRSKGPVLIG